jgi:predicted RNA-binding Zn-ribbon protein involved in translation (DUF1610 family)
MEDNRDEPSNPILIKLKQFAESIKSNQPIVFCVKCGSTLIDQTAIYKLSCLTCGNSTLWDGYNFAIARDGSAYDAAHSFENLEYHFGHFKDWHFLAIKEIQDFARSAIEFIPKSVTYLEGGSDVERRGAGYQQLVEQWRTFKSQMNKLILNEPEDAH